MSGPGEWTILVFLNAKNDLEPFAFPNFEQMASLGSTPEVKIVVEMGRPRIHHSMDFGAWSKTLRFEISKGTRPIEADAVADLGATENQPHQGGDRRELFARVRHVFPRREAPASLWKTYSAAGRRNLHPMQVNGWDGCARQTRREGPRW